jgi:hypothetical protein
MAKPWTDLQRSAALCHDCTAAAYFLSEAFQWNEQLQGSNLSLTTQSLKQWDHLIITP